MTAFQGFPRPDIDYAASDVGYALAGLIARGANGMPRVGMLGVGPKIKAVAASWKIEVEPFVYVSHVQGAVEFSGLSTAEQADILPAAGNIPAGQARIDLLCWSTEASELVVLRGIPAAIPTQPSAGLLAPVAAVRVVASDGMVIGGQITPRYAKSRLPDSGESRTVPVALDGTAGWNGVVSWRNFKEIKFATPFDTVPVVIAQGVFDSSAVQDLDVTSVSKTGFKGRVKRFGHSVPIAGQVSYTATEE